MVERKLKKAINHWLDAERGDDANRAEVALRRVFLRLPTPAPSTDFVDQVLLRLGISPAQLSTPLGWGLRWKVALGLFLALFSLAATTLPRVAAALWTGFGPERAIDWGSSMVVAAGARLAHGIVLWDALSEAARAVSASLYSPALLAALTASTLLGVGALRLLHDLVITESDYVQPH